MAPIWRSGMQSCLFREFADESVDPRPDRVAGDRIVVAHGGHGPTLDRAAGRNVWGEIRLERDRDPRGRGELAGQTQGRARADVIAVTAHARDHVRWHRRVWLRPGGDRAKRETALR